MGFKDDCHDRANCSIGHTQLCLKHERALQDARQGWAEAERLAAVLADAELKIDEALAMIEAHSRR